MPKLAEHFETMPAAEVLRIREALQLTQGELAVLLGMRHRSQVARLESGERSVRGATLILLRQLQEEADLRRRN